MPLNIFAFAGSAALALSAVPQSPTSALEDRSAAVYEAARCIVQTNRSAATLLLMSLPTGGEPAHSSAMETAARAGCGAERLAPGDALALRGGLSQALFLADFGQFGLEPRNPRGLIDLGLPAESDPVFDSARDLYRWSDCVVRNDTENVHPLFRTPVASRQERQVVDAMAPYMSACARPMARIVVDQSELRSLFAQSAYQASYRYWSGRLRSAEALDDSPSAQIVCRASPETATRIRSRRICLSRADWVKVENGIRDDLFEAQRRWTAGAGR